MRLLAAIVLLAWPVSSPGQTVIWTGADATNHVNTNWSDSANWTGGTPGAAANISFTETAASPAQGTVDNIVGTSATILSLEYVNTNNFHTTQISAGKVLAISNNTAVYLISAGTGTDNGLNQTSYSMITGPGTLSVIGTNTGSYFTVQQGSASSGSHRATLDLSGLANLNLTVGRLAVGSANPGSGANNWLAGTLYLAATNSIRLNGAAPAFNLGDATANGATSFIYLGQTNAIFADSMTIAHSKATATFAFNPTLADSSPVVLLAGNTNSRMSLLTVGDFTGQSTSGSTVNGAMNLTLGAVNAQVDTCYVARGQTGGGGGPTTGTLSLGAGVFNVNTLNLGYASVNNATGSVTGTLNLTNGTLVVNNNLLLAANQGAVAPTTGTLNISNGTVLANGIGSGGGTAKVYMSGGLLVVTNGIGSSTAPLTSLSLNKSAALQIWVLKNQTNVFTTALTGDNTGVINVSALPIIITYPTPLPLVYCPHGGAAGAVLSAGTLPGTFQGYISNDNSSTIWLVITNGPALPKTDLWGGAVNGNWDTSTLNWTNNGAAVAYAEDDPVVFTDSARTGSVNLVGVAPHTPYSWTVSNNALNYTFTGTNSVGGSAQLLKSGTATLTLSESGDTFNGGIIVNGGTLILNQPAAAISGGLVIGSGATLQIGGNNANGALPSGSITNNGSLVFNHTITDSVTASLAGTGSLTQKGGGTVVLSGLNTYTGNTVITGGTLAVAGSGAPSASANVIVSNATLNVSAASGSPLLLNLNMTNGAVTVGATTVSVSTLNLGGSANTINVAALPSFQFNYPTNITLIHSAGGIHGYNFALGSLPAAGPPYAGSVQQSGNDIVLTLTSGPPGIVPGTVSFSSTNLGIAVNPAFCGLSYEKSQLTGSLFTSNDVSLIKMFGQIAPAVLRVGGNSVDTTCWGGLSGKTPITAAQVDAFAGFVKALPTNWHVIYGINMSVNTPANCAAEAAYAANALGSSLLGFEIGNEVDLYSGNGIRSNSFTFSEFLSEWQVLAAAITNAVPGWAVTNGGNGWVFTGPASAYNTTVYTVPFARDEVGFNAMVTQHYYRANGQSPSSTLQLLLQLDTSIPGTVQNIVTNSTALPLGFRMAECGSFYNGGAPNVSDAYGTALWALDFMFTIALNGGQGINFHGGGSGTGYTPIADNGTAVVQARPEFYGLKMFSLATQGKAIPATVSLVSNINFSAYGVRLANGRINALLNNKETNDTAVVSINLGPGVTGAQVLSLSGPDLSATSGYTLGGAPINADGSWSGGYQATIAATNGQLTVTVPPITAMLLNPLMLPTNLTSSLAAGQLHVTWPPNYTGWMLQSNSLNLLNSSDWFTVLGSTNTNSLKLPISSSQKSVFYRLVAP